MSNSAATLLLVVFTPHTYTFWSLFRKNNFAKKYFRCPYSLCISFIFNNSGTSSFGKRRCYLRIQFHYAAVEHLLDDGGAGGAAGTAAFYDNDKGQGVVRVLAEACEKGIVIPLALLR